MLKVSSFNKVLRRVFQEATLIHFAAFFKSFTLKKLANLIIINLQYIVGSSRVYGYPYTLTIDSNNICNLKCVLCPTGQNKIEREKGMMSFKEFKEIFDKFTDYIFILNMYAWGEPFLTGDIFRMIKYAKTRRVFVSLSTNFNIAEIKMEEIVESNLDSLIISLDGTDQKTYQKYKHGGNFYRVIKNVKKLIELKRKYQTRNPSIQLQYLVFKHNQDKIPDIIRLANQLKVDSLDIIKGKWTNDRSYLTNLEGLQEKDKVKVKRCVYPWNKMLIHWDGGIVPCPFKYNKRDDLGNIKKGNINEIWNSDKFKIIRKQHLNPKSVQDITICNGCPRARF